MKIIPLYDTKAVLDNWHYFAGGFERLLKEDRSIGDTNLQVILNDLLSAKLLLWVIFDDADKYAGFYTTRVEAVPFGNRFLHITMAYLVDKFAKDGWYEKCLDEITKQAKKFDCKKIIFYSKKDKAYEKIMRSFGYFPEQVKFVKEVN